MIRRFARVVAPRAHRRHDRPRPGPRRHRPRSSASQLGADALHRQHRDAAQRQLLRPPVPGARRPPPHARPRAGRPRRPRLVPARAPTPAAPCGPRPRTRTGPCCSASRSAGCRRSCGRIAGGAVDRHLHHQGAVHRRRARRALVGATAILPGPGRRRHRPVPVAAGRARRRHRPRHRRVDDPLERHAPSRSSTSRSSS